jgi:nucleolin
MHMQIFEGRRVVAQFAQMHLRKNDSSQTPSKTLYIGNISYDMTDKDLHDLFRDIRNLIDVRVSIDRKTGQPKGFAHAEFVDIPSAQAAFEILSSKAPYGRKLRLDYSFTNKGRWREMNTQEERNPSN